MKLGPADGFPIELALLNGHYFVLKQTKFNSWALKNYEDIRHKKRWWEFKSATRRDAKRGVDTLEMLTMLEDTPMMKPIDVSTLGIFMTQFHDKALQDFTTLEYPESHCRLHHPPRDFGQGIVYTGMQRSGSALTDWLQNEGLRKWVGRPETIYDACKSILNGSTNKKGEILGVGPKVRELIKDHYPGSVGELYTLAEVCESGG